MEETKPSAPLLYPNISTFSKEYINDKIQANKKFNNNINVINDIRIYYETETINNNQKTSTSVALAGIGLPYSISTVFATATIYGSLSKTVNTKIRNKTLKYSQMYIISKQSSDKFNTL